MCRGGQIYSALSMTAGVNIHFVNESVDHNMLTKDETAVIFEAYENDFEFFPGRNNDEIKVVTPDGIFYVTTEKFIKTISTMLKNKVKENKNVST